MKFYIIDEKASRQKEYGWGNKDFKDNELDKVVDKTLNEVESYLK